MLVRPRLSSRTASRLPRRRPAHPALLNRTQRPTASYRATPSSLPHLLGGSSGEGKAQRSGTSRVRLLVLVLML
jgi:hypothetical protein